jgi:hypothetical protein
LGMRIERMRIYPAAIKKLALLDLCSRRRGLIRA